MNPNLDMVVDDLMTIVDHLFEDDADVIDMTAPLTEAVTDPGANANGWHFDDVRVDLAATDAGGSGVEQIEHSTTGAQASGPVITPGESVYEIITLEGVTTLHFQARDIAGNVEASKEFVVRLDRTAPEISAETSVEPNGLGWFNSSVTVTFVASDALSGLASSSPEVMVATEGANQEIVGTAEDLAGNEASAFATLNIDRTLPDVSIATPPDGAVYLLNATVHGGYQCVDTLSGVASCTGTVADGATIDTAAVGQKAFVVDAMDRADNAAVRTQTYSVQYGFSGFARPIAPAGTVNVANAGRVVPVKYGLRDANGMPISDLTSFESLTSFAVSCDAPSSSTLGEVAQSVGATTIRYDSKAMQFVFNWKTERAWGRSCRVLRLELNDGTEHLTLFRFR